MILIFFMVLGSGESSGAGSADSKPNKHQTPNMSSEEEGGCVSTVEHTSSGTLPSTDSQKLSSSQSNSNSTDSQNGMAYDPDFKGLPVTKEILGRHNEEMEKEFMQQHRYISFFNSIDFSTNRKQKSKPFKG